MMNIVYMCQHFYPEIGAPSIRILELSKEWVKSGHNVTVVTAFPNHPTGKIPDQYRGCIFKTEYHEGIRILRNFIYATPNKGKFRRIVSHLSFMISSLILSLPRLGKADVIIVSSPPFFSAISGFIMSCIKRRPFVFEVRDLWPAAINDLGVVKSGLIIKVLESLELFLYRRAQKVVVVTESFKEDLIRRGIPLTKIEVIFNGVDPGRFTGIDAKTVKRTYGLEERMVILYSGTHGIAHSLEMILMAAERLRNLSYR
jgi:glycosyltransferase involved in cell wall biosynthesis